jgi:hypothetical protein
MIEEGLADCRKYYIVKRLVKVKSFNISANRTRETFDGDLHTHTASPVSIDDAKSRFRKILPGEPGYNRDNTATCVKVLSLADPKAPSRL